MEPTQVGRRESDSAGRPCSGSRPVIRSRWTARWLLGGRASIRRRSPASLSRYSEKKGDPVYAGTINAKGRWKSRPWGRSETCSISRVVAQVREVRPVRLLPIERRISRFKAIYTPLVIGSVAVGHARSTPVGPDHKRGRCGRLGIMAQSRTGRGLVVLVIACPSCAGDRNAGGRRLWTGGRGARGRVGSCRGCEYLGGDRPAYAPWHSIRPAP